MPFRVTLDDLLLPAHAVHDGACIVDCSPDLASMFGYGKPEEVIGSSLLQFIDPAHQEKTVHQILAGECGSYESLGRRKSGTTFPLEVCARPVLFGGSQARLILIRDLSPIALVVDDEAIVCKMTASLVQRAGYRTLLADSAEAALENFQPGKLALVVTDVCMPGAGGIELGRRVRAADPTLPIVYVSGFCPEEIALDENSHYVPKPFGIGELEEVLHSLPLRHPPASDPCGFNSSGRIAA